MISLVRLTWPKRLRALWPSRPPKPAIHTAASQSAMRRVDLYVLALLVLGGIVWYAHSDRYAVTHYQVDQSLAYQRTDKWTGRTELWVVGRTAKPHWIGLTDAIPRPSPRRAAAPTAAPGKPSDIVAPGRAVGQR
jgi:hypothetical protein